MNERACPGVDALCAPDFPGIVHLSPSWGAFTRRRARYFSQSRKPLLTAEQQLALIKLIRDGDNDAKRRMIAHNMHLVVDFAKHYANRGLLPLELIWQGSQGLIHALDEYKPDGSFSFLAYATWCICENIERAIINCGKPSRRRPFRPAVDRHPASSPVQVLLPNKPLDSLGACVSLAA